MSQEILKRPDIKPGLLKVTILAYKLLKYGTEVTRSLSCFTSKTT